MTSKQALSKLKNDKKYSDGVINAIEKAIDKLSQLEDIEELCEKIVSQPVYNKFVDTGEIYKEDYTEYYYALYDFKKESIDIFYYDFVGSYDLKDYKKTWAFSREELL